MKNNIKRQIKSSKYLKTSLSHVSAAKKIIPPSSGSQLLTDLTDEQRKAVTTTMSPLCVIAEAGSGKTRVITRRIAWQTSKANINPQQVLAVTFTRQAARELQLRLKKLNLRDKIKAGTFHSIAIAQLNRYNADRGRKALNILTDQHRFICEMLMTGRKKRPTGRGTITDIKSEIHWARARLISPQDYPAKAEAARRMPPFGNAEHFVKVYEEYTKAKHTARILDLDDVLAHCQHLMVSDADHALTQYWLNKHILVDEFQDVNPLQFSLLKSWIGKDSTLVVVGDPNQAIYGWNGSDPELLNNLPEYFPNCAILRLNMNFRSTPEILEVAGRILDKPAQPAFQASGIAPTITMVNGEDEPTALLRAIRSRQPPGKPWRTQAVLARTNSQLIPLRQALARSGIPVAAKRDRDLMQQPAIISLIKEWSSDASLATCVTDSQMAVTALERAISAKSSPVARNQRFDPSAPTLQHTRDLQNLQSHSQSHHPQNPQIYATNHDSRNDCKHTHDPQNHGISRQDYDFKWQRNAVDGGKEAIRSACLNVESFICFASDHLVLNPKATVGSFTIDMELGDRSNTHHDGVNFLTFHSAKGLEWPIVHIVGLEKGYVPARWAITQQAKAEEQRLLYVATTRALKELHIMWCNQRIIKNQNMQRHPSPWLDAFHLQTMKPLDGQAALQAIAIAREKLKTAKTSQTQTNSTQNVRQKKENHRDHHRSDLHNEKDSHHNEKDGSQTLPF